MGPYKVSSDKQCKKISAEEKENIKMAVLKVVRIRSKTRTSESLRYWVAVAVGNFDGMIGLADHFATNEKRATKCAEKKAMKRLRRINRLEDRTVHRRVFGRSGGDLVSLSLSSAQRCRHCWVRHDPKTAQYDRNNRLLCDELI